ncbi:MAG: hypothetical protein ACT4PJ_03020 [Gemmatimonadaceae bacterium]
MIMALVVATPIPLAAQEAPVPVAVGARVRLTLPDLEPRFGVRPPERWLVGEVVAVTPDTLALRPHPGIGPVAVPRSAIRRVEIGRGASRWQSAAGGAVGGAPVGLLWGHVLYDVGLRGPHFDTGARARSSGALWSAVGFTVLGALFPPERWRRVSFE